MYPAVNSKLNKLKSLKNAFLEVVGKYPSVFLFQKTFLPIQSGFSSVKLENTKEGRGKGKFFRSLFVENDFYVDIFGMKFVR